MLEFLGILGIPILEPWIYWTFLEFCSEYWNFLEFSQIPTIPILDFSEFPHFQHWISWKFPVNIGIPPRIEKYYFLENTSYPKKADNGAIWTKSSCRCVFPHFENNGFFIEKKLLNLSNVWAFWRDRKSHRGDLEACHILMCEPLEFLNTPL